MPRPRKRKQSDRAEEGPSARFSSLQASKSSRHAVLNQAYPQVLSLREFILSRLPSTSRIRKRKIAAVGTSTPPPISPLERSLAALLDDSRVGISEDNCREPRHDRWEQWLTFSQRGDESYVTLSDGIASSIFSQSEIVDFVIWSLFNKARNRGFYPRHLLCDGFRRNRGPVPPGQDSDDGGGRTIPGIFSVSPNHNVESLKMSPWPELLALLGQSGEFIMIDLLLDCAIFVAVKAGKDNFCQISGKPILEPEPRIDDDDAGPKAPIRSPSDIIFVRHRMLYARAALNARGSVRFGLRHIRVFSYLLRSRVVSIRCRLTSSRRTQSLPPSKRANRW